MGLAAPRFVGSSWIRDRTYVSCISRQNFHHWTTKEGQPSLSFKCWVSTLEGFPGGSDGKGSACNAGDPGLIPGLGICPGGGNGTLVFLLGESVHGVTKSWTLLSNRHRLHLQLQLPACGASVLFTFVTTCSPVSRKVRSDQLLHEEQQPAVRMTQDVECALLSPSSPDLYLLGHTI